jgi:hypothetical protein
MHILIYRKEIAMNRSSLPVSVNTMKKWYESDDKVLQCTLPFQRHSGMWSPILKSNLVWSMLADSYIPPIVLLKDKRGEDSKGKDIFGYQVLEGQQRLITTLFPFLNDEWTLHGSVEPVEVDGFTYDIAGRKFSELEEELQDIIKNYRFTVQAIENYTMEEAEKLYFNINSGVALSAMQKGKAKLGTELIEFLNTLLAGSFFTQGINITEKQALKEDDLLMLMQGMALLDMKNTGRDFKTISASAMLGYAESIRGSYSEDAQQTLMEIVDYLDKAFPTKNKFLRKNNTPIVIVMASIALEQNVEAEAFRAFVNDFANSLYPAYEEASGSGNVKITNVKQRLKVMFIAMCDYFRWNIDDVDKPFESEEAWFLDTEDSENSEVDDDTASADEDSPITGSFMSESTEESIGTEEEGADETEENSGIFAESE